MVERNVKLWRLFFHVRRSVRGNIGIGFGRHCYDLSLLAAIPLPPVAFGRLGVRGFNEGRGICSRWSRTIHLFNRRVGLSWWRSARRSVGRMGPTATVMGSSLVIPDVGLLGLNSCRPRTLTRASIASRASTALHDASESCPRSRIAEGNSAEHRVVRPNRHR